jgi:hypothetical protein
VKYSGKSTNYKLLHSTQQTKEEHNKKTTNSLWADNSCCRVRQVLHYYPYKIKSDRPTQVACPQDLPPATPLLDPSSGIHTIDSNSYVQGPETNLTATTPSIISNPVVSDKETARPAHTSVFWPSSPIETSKLVDFYPTRQRTGFPSNKQVQILHTIASRLQKFQKLDLT